MISRDFLILILLPAAKQINQLKEQSAKADLQVSFERTVFIAPKELVVEQKNVKGAETWSSGTELHVRER